MKTRCKNSNHRSYKDYGAKGITVCERWESFDNFADDMASSYQKLASEIGEKSVTIERIDPTMGYKPENCTWIHKSKQCDNRSISRRVTYRGKEVFLAELARTHSISRKLLYNRIYVTGWSVEKSLTAPLWGRES